MSIYPPDVFLTDTDRELLSLLADLVLSWSADRSSNTSHDGIPLSNSEAARLLALLEEFVSSRRFVEGTYLIEGLFSGDPNEKNLREVYLSGRRNLGKSRAVATVQWENFLQRLGVRRSRDGYTSIWYRPTALPMSLDYFVRMERKLANAARVHPRVRELIVKLVQDRLAYIRAVRSGRRRLEPGNVRSPPEDLLYSLKGGERDPIGPPPMKTSKIVGVMTIVMDLSVLYTTRDWSVTSVLSALAGAAPPVMLD